MTINITRKGPDGRTGWEKRHCHAFKRPITRRQGNVAADGVFLGVALPTTYWLVVTMELWWERDHFGGFPKVELFLKVRGVPWAPRVSDVD